MSTNTNKVEGCIPVLPECEGNIDAKTLPVCDSSDITPEGRTGPIVVKVPVVIGEQRIQIDLESTITLEESAIEIKRIRKNIYVTQCKLLPKSNKLFLEGYVRKNIEYPVARCSSRNVVSGEIRHTTVNVPFRCVTQVAYVVPPIYNPNLPVLEYETLDEAKKCCRPCGKEVIGKDRCEDAFQNFEYFNEKVYCELIEAEFEEVDIKVDPMPLNCRFPDELVFRDVTEKMVVYLTVKLLQNQQVLIPNNGVATV